MTAPTFVNASTPQTGAAQNMTVNLPGSRVVGNYVFVLLKQSQQSTATTHAAGVFTVVTGFNCVNHQALWYRKIDGSEANSYTFSAPALQTITDGVSFQVSGVIGSGNPIDVFITGRDIVGSTSSVSLAVTTTVADTLLAYGDSKNAASRTLNTAPTGMTDRTGPTTTTHVFTAPQTAVGGSGNKQATFTGTNTLHFDALFAIKSPPAQTVTPTGFDAAVAFGAPTLVREVNPAGFDVPVSFGSPTVTVESLVVEPAGFDTLVVFGSPSLGQTVAVGGFDVPVQFGAAVPILDNVLAVTGFDVPVSFGGVTLAAQTIVTGTVFNHETGDPVGAGVTVKLFDDSDVLIDTTVTDGASTFTFYRPFGDTTLYWTLAEYELVGIQYHGVSDRGCPAL